MIRSTKLAAQSSRCCRAAPRPTSRARALATVTGHARRCPSAYGISVVSRPTSSAPSSCAALANTIGERGPNGCPGSKDGLAGSRPLSPPPRRVGLRRTSSTYSSKAALSADDVIGPNWPGGFRASDQAIGRTCASGAIPKASRASRSPGGWTSKVTRRVALIELPHHFGAEIEPAVEDSKASSLRMRPLSRCEKCQSSPGSAPRWGSPTGAARGGRGHAARSCRRSPDPARRGRRLPGPSRSACGRCGRARAGSSRVLLSALRR